MTTTKPKSITIIAKRWFNRGPGNTYFSAQILVDGKPVHKIDYAYGYGDHYRDCAADWLTENGYVDLPRHENGSRQPLWEYCRENGIELYCTASDVERKKDL